MRHLQSKAYSESVDSALDIMHVIYACFCHIAFQTQLLVNDFELYRQYVQDRDYADLECNEW